MGGKPGDDHQTRWEPWDPKKKVEQGGEEKSGEHTPGKY